MSWKGVLVGVSPINEEEVTLVFNVVDEETNAVVYPGLRVSGKYDGVIDRAQVLAGSLKLRADIAKAIVVGAEFEIPEPPHVKHWFGIKVNKPVVEVKPKPVVEPAPVLPAPVVEPQPGFGPVVSQPEFEPVLESKARKASKTTKVLKAEAEAEAKVEAEAVKADAEAKAKAEYTPVGTYAEAEAARAKTDADADAPYNSGKYDHYK